MSTNRLVKWSKEGKEFFEKAKDNSVTLDLVISFGCASQTGEGFEELVNTINSESIKRKVKKVIITDTSYLYRHDIAEFAKYADPNVPTEWYLKNKEAIEKLEVEKEVKSWAVGLNTKEFKKWHDKIRRDFEGDENGVGIVLEFRDKVMQASSVAAYKNNVDIKGCIDFILEECAYSCAFLDNVVMAYPGKPAISVEMSMQTNNMKFFHLDYKISETSSKINKIQNRNSLDLEIIDKEISIFMKEKVSNVNFFVIDKYGTPLCINNALDKSVGKVNAKKLNPKSWETTCEVIRTGRQIITEEQSLEGNNYLTVKSPLILDGKIKGVIGLAVDITDRKKREDEKKKRDELEIKLKMGEKLYNTARCVAYDLAQPVNVLKGYLDLNKSLSEEEKRIFKEVARSIENIVDRLLQKYRGGKDTKVMSYIFVKWCLDKVINQKKEHYKQREIKFKHHTNFKENVFIRGNFIDFGRMMINLLNNAEEAMQGNEGEIEVSYKTIKGEEVEIRVKDNGKGMSKEMAEKLMKGEKVGTMKKGGHGIGTQQIISTIKGMKGVLKIESKEKEGTEFILRFPKTEKPRWFADKIEVKKWDTLVILDDEELVHKQWQEKLKMYKQITIKYFTQGIEALKYLKSLQEIEKEKVFLIADYELKQDITGINVIDKSGMKDRHLLVTNMYLSDIKEFNIKSAYIKTFPKMYINDISLNVN